MQHALILAALAALGLSAAPGAQAQSYTLTTLGTFSSPGLDQYPAGNLILSGGALYGVTEDGGANGDGSVFSVPVGGGPVTTLASFNGTNGSYVYDGLVLSGGTLYGTTQFGGTNGDGSVFSVPTGGGAITTVASFTGGADGDQPVGGLTLVGSALYGTTRFGGSASLTSGNGAIFSVPTSAVNATPTALAAFSGGAGGAHPLAPLILSGSGTTFYGTTNKGGDANNDGTVFSVPVGGGSITTLAALNGTNGSNPFAGLTLSASGTTLYGTAEDGGDTDGDGTLFSVPTSGGSAASPRSRPSTGPATGPIPAAN